VEFRSGGSAEFFAFGYSGPAWPILFLRYIVITLVDLKAGLILMSKLFLLIFVAAACALTAASQSGRKVTIPRPPQTAPIQPPLNPEPELNVPEAPSSVAFISESLRERQIRGLNSGNFRFADFNGKVIVINFWATWCGPCRREVPEYEKVRKAYAGKDVEFIALTTEDPRTSSDRVKSFVRDFNFGFRLGWADSEIARALMTGRGSIPQTLVVDTDGRVVDRWTGYSPGNSGSKLKQTIDQALHTGRRT
jgi:thiol-disulfide isomerase/thioredoxin